MIKPRRLLLLVLGFFVCFGAYEVYSYFLGHYDGLPPLPPEYRYNPNPGPSIAKDDDNDNRKHEIAKLLERAFGPKCPELNRYRSVEIGRPDSRTVMAFDKWELDNGELVLTEVSLANIKIIPPEGKQPAREEIVTVQGKVAVIKFNQPIKSPFEIKTGVKPIAGHIEGDVIKLTHNHGTPEPNDDITVYCKKRVDFVDAEKRVWCTEEVQVVYAFPEEARFVGVGLTIKLANELVPKEGEASRTKAKGEKPEGLGISAVKSIELERDVQFSFFKLNGSILGGALGKSDDKPVMATQQQQPAQPMVIRCKDAFIYDVPTNVATFNTNVNGLRHRMVTTPTGPKQQYDELDADEKLVLELLAPNNKSKNKTDKAAAVDDGVKQFELKKAVATGRSVKITANEDGQGNGLHAEGIELIVDNIAHEARLRGKDQVVARMMEYDIIAQGIVKILLPATDAEDKDPRGLMINGPGEVRVRASVKRPDPYTMASWQRELQWHRTTEEQRIELYGNAVLMDEKLGRMSGEQVKAWLVTDKKKPDEVSLKTDNGAAGTGIDRLNAKLKRVEVDQKVQVLSTRLIIPNANRLTLNVTEAPAGFVMQKSGDGFDTPAPVQEKSPNLLGKPEAKAATPSPNSPPLYLHAAEIDGDLLMAANNQYFIRRLEARENVHIERKPEPGKQNGIDIQGQRLEMSLQGNTDLYRVKLFGNKAIINNEKYHVEGQQIDLDQTENMLSIDGAGKFRFYTDKDFQGNLLVEGRDATGQPLKDAQGNIRVRPEQVTFVWNDRMKFGGRVAEFTGNVIAEKGDINLSCHSMTITLDKPMSLSGKDDALNKQPSDQAVALESVICNSLTQGAVGQRVNPVVIEQRVKPGAPDRHILRIEGVQVVFDNSTKDKEIIKVFGPGEVNLVRAGQNQMGGLGTLPGQPGAAAPNQPGEGAAKPAGSPLQLKLTRVLFEQEMEYRKSEGTLRFWKNVRTFHVPGDDVGMPLDEKRMPKEGLYIACEKMVIAAIQGPMNSALHEMTAEDNVEMRANQTSYVKCDILTYSETKGQVVMRGKGANDALYYYQEKPGGQFLTNRAKAFKYDMKTGSLEVDQAKSLQIK